VIILWQGSLFIFRNPDLPGILLVHLKSHFGQIPNRPNDLNLSLFSLLSGI